MHSTRARTIPLLRALTNLAGLALFVVVASQAVVQAGPHRTIPGQPAAYPAAALDLRVALLVGLLVAAAWEGVGGVMAMCSGLGLCAYAITSGSAGLGVLGMLAVVVGLAHLACGWPSSRALRAAPRIVRSPAALAAAISRRARGPWQVARQLPEREPARRLETARARIEAGAGGDLETGERPSGRRATYVPGLRRTVSAWMRLRERVERGDLGGVDDGATARDPPPGVR